MYNGSNHGSYIKASFMLNEQVMFAFFDPSGEFTGVARNILSPRTSYQPAITVEEGNGRRMDHGSSGVRYRI
jgi:hypothetical protein